MATRFAEDGTILGVYGLACDIGAIRGILDRFERAAQHKGKEQA